MLKITCPWCGPRAESEFSCGGEAHIVRPLDTDALDDRQWGDYLFMRKNPKGQHFEQWHHSQGCRRWFNAERDTVTYRFKQFYKPGEQPQGVEVAAVVADAAVVPELVGAPATTAPPPAENPAPLAGTDDGSKA
ncbi:MAG: sarcosine oxidase subunit delta [Rhodoferax sp.]|nr:sarcosine oxidase subunit delta [Rhodoferax sp.]